MRILFQGDSITDAGRDRRNFHDMGNGYPKYAAMHLRERFPNTEFDFINLGISGNRTDQLFDRLYKDAIELSPDVISILIGVNDVWHRFGDDRIETTDAQIETNYRAILERLKAQTNAKIVMIEPYVLDSERAAHLREGVDRVVEMERRLAKEFADAFIPLSDLFDEAISNQPEPLYYSRDGVHPNENGAAFIGKIYAEEMAKLLEREFQL